MPLQNFLQQGGPVMYILLGMSVVVVAIVLLKLIQFSRMGFRRTSIVDDVMERLENNDVAGARAELAKSRSPVAAVMDTAIALGSDPTINKADTEAEISRVGTATIRSMESWLRLLSSIAHLSPLLGLLGTVMGMIAAFMDIQAVGSDVDPAVLSGGIWVALLTTAFGLAIAIPAMGAYFYLEGEVDNTRATMKDATVRVLVHFRKGSVVADTTAVLSADTVEGESYGV